jgi:hypothetical protein
MKRTKVVLVLLVLLLTTAVAAIKLWASPDYGQCHDCGQIWKRPKWSIGLGSQCMYCGHQVEWQSPGGEDYDRYRWAYDGFEDGEEFRAAVAPLPQTASSKPRQGQMRPVSSKS